MTARRLAPGRRSPAVDTYDRIARLYPAYIALLPVSVLLVAVFGTDEWWKLGLGLLAGAGVPYLLTDMVRRYGKASEIDLFTRWGGPPTTELVRCNPRDSATEDNLTLRERRRAAVVRHSGIDLPTSEDELADPVAADRQYAAAMYPLRKKFINDPQVARELRHYGLWRNLYGLRHLICRTGLASSAVAVLLAILDVKESLSMSTPLLCASAAVGVTAVFVSWRVLTAEAVHGPARNYAEQLMQAACAS